MTTATTVINFTNPFTLATLPPINSIEAYTQAVARIPLLTQEEETHFARRLRDHNDVEAAQHLIVPHLRIVVSIARHYFGYGLAHADLIQEGNIGLMKAVKRFDPERGVRLVSFAMHWIRAEIHEFILRNWRIVKIATTKAQRKLFFNLRSMRTGLDTMNHHEVDDMADTLHVRSKDVTEMEVRLGSHDIALEPGNYDDEKSLAPIAYLSDLREEPTHQIEAAERDWLHSEGLQSALAQLDDRSRTIIQRRWLAEDNTQSATLHDLAGEYGVSAERIRQIEVKALQKMKLNLLPA